MRKFLCVVTLLLVPSLAYAQSNTYEMRYYQPGAQSPFQTQMLAPVCNQDPVLSTINVNPTRIVWDDPNASGRACVHTEVPNGVLLSFPVGNYEGALVAINSFGTSPESNRSPFVIGVVPGVPTGVRIVR